METKGYEKALALGRKLRNEQLKRWKNQLPSIKKLFVGNVLDLEKWFNFYRKLLETGPRKIKKLKCNKNVLSVTYSNYSKGKLKDFTVKLPRKIKIDSEFEYFFGLWCGERTGGGRIGILNKSPELLQFTSNFLKKKLYQKPEFVLLTGSKFQKRPKLPFKITCLQKVKGMCGDWVVSVHSRNGILKTFFYYLHNYLSDVLKFLQNKNVFFAGLFDAEGNIFFEDGDFRWSCKNLRDVEIYKKYLRRLDLFKRYDGSNLVTNSIVTFVKLILPYLKHKNKINGCRLLVFGKGYLDKKFRRILTIIKANENGSVSELGKIANRKRLWSQIRFLENYKYITSQGYPKRVFITSKGLTELGREGQ